MSEKDPNTPQMGKDLYPFEMGYLPDFFKTKAEVELKDTAENRQKGLKILKDLIDGDKNTSGLSFDDDFLLQYLRCRKFDAEKAFVQLKAFVNFRKNYRNMFNDFHFEKLAIAIKSRTVTFLPYRCQDGCAIIHIQIDNWVPEDFPPEEMKRMVVILILQSLRDPMTQVNGFKVIYNFKCNNYMTYLKYYTPSNLYLLYHGTQEIAPGRFKEIHVVNPSLVFKACWPIFRLLLSPKLKRRVFLHNTPEKLLDHFPAAVIPVQYGGELEDYDMTDWLRGVMSPAKLATLGGGSQPVSS